MDATIYLNSLGLQVKPLTDVSVGRLAIRAEFFLGNDRGVVVRPKRGGISARYLDLLADNGVSFVLLDTQPWFQIFGRVTNNQALSRFRALPVAEPNRFPPPVVLEAVSELIRKACASKKAALKIGARLLAAKIADEASGGSVFGSHLVDTNSKTGTDDILGWEETNNEKIRIGNTEHFLSAAAILAGYRLTPKTGEEASGLIDYLGSLADGRQQIAGLPAACATAFAFEDLRGSNTLVVAQSVGSQLLSLRKSKKGTAILPAVWSSAQELLGMLFPSVEFADVGFLKWSPDVAPDRVVLVPPFGTFETADETLDRYELSRRGKRRLSRVPSEILYIEHAVNIAAQGAILIMVVPEGLLSSVGHSDFRSWLLEHIRLLGIISLPVGFCFKGSGIRCSLLFAQKVDPIPADYPILMMEAQEQDLATDEGRLAIQKAIKDTLERKAGLCG